MKKQQLVKNIIRYTFDPRPGVQFSTSVIAIFNGDKVMLIDTAYEDQMSKLLDKFSKNNIEVEQVIISHFHGDHMEGLKALPKVPVYGSSHYQKTLDRWTAKEEHIHFTPSIKVDKPLSFTYGEHNLTLIPFPGHSVCSMLINIDDHFLHIADELMASPVGEPLLPSSDGNDMKRHLNSLDRLRSYEGFTIIPGHGPTFPSEELISEIENRYHYLKALHDSDGVISYENAIEKCTSTFVHSEWHKYNCK